MNRLRNFLLRRVLNAALAAALGAAVAAPAATAEVAFLIAATIPLAGDGHDHATDLALDAEGNAWIAGVVGSYNFPGLDTAVLTNGGVDLRYVARVDALQRMPSFVAAVGAPTASLADTRLRSFARDEARGLALDAAGNAYLVAHDGSRDYPATGGTYRATTSQKHVFRVGPTGTVTRLSAGLDPAIRRVGAIALDPAGYIYLTGSAGEGLATSPGAPFPGSSVASGCLAPYVIKLDPSGQQLIYATYLGVAGVAGQACGGAVSSGFFDPTGFALVVDAGGNVYVTGQAEPGLAATVGAVNQPSTEPAMYAGGESPRATATHAFVAKLAASGTALAWVARLGGSGWDRGTSIAVDPAGGVIIGGKTSSPGLSSWDRVALFPWVQRECLIATPEVGFVARLAADGRQVTFVSYLPAYGGQFDNCGRDRGFAPLRIAVDSAGTITAAGRTEPALRDLNPSGNALEPIHTGNQLLHVFGAAGGTDGYSTSFAGAGVEGMARDRWGQVVVVDQRGTLQRLAPQTLPLEISTEPPLACSGQVLTVTSRVAASHDEGSVTFKVDGVVVGSATVSDGTARLGFVPQTGVRRIVATYSGPGWFDGYSSHAMLVPVNQAGVCP